MASPPSLLIRSNFRIILVVVVVDVKWSSSGSDISMEGNARLHRELESRRPFNRSHARASLPYSLYVPTFRYTSGHISFRRLFL